MRKSSLFSGARNRGGNGNGFPLEGNRRLVPAGGVTHARCLNGRCVNKLQRSKGTQRVGASCAPSHPCARQRALPCNEKKCPLTCTGKRDASIVKQTSVFCSENVFLCVRACEAQSGFHRPWCLGEKPLNSFDPGSRLCPELGSAPDIQINLSTCSTGLAQCWPVQHKTWSLFQHQAENKTPDPTGFPKKYAP